MHIVKCQSKIDNIINSSFTDLFDELKPELIAPVVFWLCHETCTENGSIIEAALGWAGKCKYWKLYYFKLKLLYYHIPYLTYRHFAFLTLKKMSKVKVYLRNCEKN